MLFVSESSEFFGSTNGASHVGDTEVDIHFGHSPFSTVKDLKTLNRYMMLYVFVFYNLMCF